MSSYGTIFARNNIIEQYTNKEPFWDPYEGTPQYSLLNKVIIPTPEAIRAYQIEKIQNFEKNAFKKFSNLDGISKNNFNMLFQSFQTDETKKINKMLEEFVTKMNSFYYANKDENKSKKDWEYLQKRLEALKTVLNDLIKELNIPKTDSFGLPTVMGSTLELINNALKACNLSSLNPNEINNFLKHINQLKGDTLEELGVAYIRSLNLPNVASIRLGNVYLNTKKQGQHSGQLIQDFIAYDINSPDILKDTIVEYKPIGSNKTIKAPLSQLFADIEKANGQSQQIVITDDTYDVLTNLQSLNIQAKSGKNQLPWNKNKSTQVSINEYGKTEKLAISVKTTFNLLHSLNKKENNKQPWLIKNSSNDYNALANYGLATVMNKVLHISQKENQYLLTPYGFMTFSERMKQLLSQENYIALIQEKVILNDNTLYEKYNVGITKK